MNKVYVFDIEKVNSILLSHTDVCIEEDVDGWFYSVTEEYDGFDDIECCKILGKELNAKVEDIVVDITKGKVAVIYK